MKAKADNGQKPVRVAYNRKLAEAVKAEAARLVALQSVKHPDAERYVVEMLEMDMRGEFTPVSEYQVTAVSENEAVHCIARRLRIRRNDYMGRAPRYRFNVATYSQALEEV